MASNFAHTINTLSRLLTALVLLTGGLWGVAEWRRGELPPPSQIAPELLHPPIQSPVALAPFPFTYANKGYVVTPHAYYQICGLLVSHNKIDSIFDAYHTKESVDIRDMCVIWGGNLTEMDYHKPKFWSETWTCNVRIDDQDTWEMFRSSELSNNHLVPETPEVARSILKAHLGDQVCFDGMLVDYAPDENPDWVRHTSLTRDDTGNGA